MENLHREDKTRICALASENIGGWCVRQEQHIEWLVCSRGGPRERRARNSTTDAQVSRLQ
jgi:hypothetical protein